MSDPMLACLRQDHAPAPKFWFWITEDLGPIPGRLIMVADIQKQVATYFELTVHDLLSDCRTQREARPRHIAMYLSRILTRRSYEVIARLFNRSDHSVAIHAFKRISQLITADPDIASDIEAITRALA